MDNVVIKVPFVDLKAQYNTIKDEMDAAIQECIQNTSFVGGPKVKLFEEQFAQYMGVEHCISCANGTDSMEMCLKAMGVGPGDEVIVPALSWISTAEVVSSVGADVVFVDINADDYTIDVTKIEEKITERTKAIIPVHIYGQAANMPVIMNIANKYQLKVIEDCAQAHNAMVDGKKVGAWGHAASYSFYPGKNLGAYGDAGGLTTNDAELAQTVRMISNHGQLKKHCHVIEGRNSRMDTLQAAVLTVKLPHLDQWTAARMANAKLYDQKLAHLEAKGQLVRPKFIDNTQHVFHLYVVQVKDREGLKQFLTDNGVGAAIHYPEALPLLDCYKSGGYTAEDFPVASSFCKNILSLPMFPELKEEQINRVCELIESFLSK